jgi:hypothetical protein
MRKLLGSKTPIQITLFTDENFRDMLRMIKNTRKGAHGKKELLQSLGLASRVFIPWQLSLKPLSLAPLSISIQALRRSSTPYAKLPPRNADSLIRSFIPHRAIRVAHR